MEIKELAGVISTIIIAAITGYISSKIAYGREIERRIYIEREMVYVDLFELLEKLKRNPYLVFNSIKFLDPFVKLKARLNLYASQEIIDIISPLNDKICDISEEYFARFDSIEGEMIKENRIEYENTTELELQQEEVLYMEKNVIDSIYVEDVLCCLISQIRQELKTE